MKVKTLIIFLTIVLFFAGSLFYINLAVKAESPTGLKVTLYKTELYTDRNGSSVLVFDNPQGKEVDIVRSPGIFGEGNVPEGTYKRIKFTVAPQGRYSGPDPCNQGQQINDQTFNIGSNEIYFATADDGGSTSWTADGSSQKPFLLQSPIVVKGGKTTTVKLIFNTANTLQCQGNQVVLFPPSMNVVSLVEEVSGPCTITGAWWFVFYNISVWPRVCDDPSCSTYHFPSEPHEIFNNTSLAAGWGTVTFNEDSTWTINAGSSYEDRSNPGVAVHRHKLLYYNSSDPEEGYHNPAGTGTFMGTYARSGNRIIMYFPGGGYIEGAISSDCRTFTGVNVAGEEENNIVFAVKKGTGLSLLPGKYIMSQLGFDLCYDVSGSNCNFTGDKKIKFMEYRNEFSIGDISNQSLTAVWWLSGQEYFPQYDQDKLKAIYLKHPREEIGIRQGSLSDFPPFRDDGLALPQGEEPMFAALGENMNGLFAGLATGAKEGNDRIVAGFIINLASAPAPSDLDGTWQISLLESEVEPGPDNTWQTDDDRAWYGLTYGEVRIKSGAVTYRSFIHKNIFDGKIRYEAGSGETIQLKTECYNPGVDLSTACSDPNAPRIPVFYIYGTGSEAGRILGKMALDNSKRVLVFWAPVDLNETPPPPTSPCPYPSQNETKYCDDNGGNTKALFGVGVKIE